MNGELRERCTKCDTPTWIGDRYCRRCGTERVSSEGTGGDAVHIIDLAGESDDRRAAAARRPVLSGRRGVAFVTAGIAALALIFFLVRTGGDGPDALADDGGEPTPSAIPTSIFNIDNPPERQAALDAFEARRERQWTLEKVFDAFAIDDSIVIHADDSSLWLRSDADGAVDPERTVPGVAFGTLGPVTSTPYRVGPDNRVTIERFDVDLDRWRAEPWSAPPSVAALAPFEAIATSDTHIATEAGGLVRIWQRSDGQQSAAVPGRLRPSTGDLFFIGGQAYDSDAELQPLSVTGMLRLAQAGIRVWDDRNGDGQVQEDETFVPNNDGAAPIRSVITTDWKALIDPSGWLVTRALQEPALPYNGDFVDIAPIANDSALLALSVDSLLVIRFDGSPPIEVPVEISDARALSLVPPAS